PPSVPSRYRFTACILSFEENLAIKNAPPIVNYVSNNWGALQFLSSLFLSPPLLHPHYGINNRIMKNILIMTNVKKNLSL
ncbi:hypothetical protein P4H73_21660, partial [Bacillus cereus]|nr:hypothetical protein [Bacillus cereus]